MIYFSETQVQELFKPLYGNLWFLRNDLTNYVTTGGIRRIITDKSLADLVQSGLLRKVPYGHEVTFRGVLFYYMMHRIVD